MIFIIAGLPPRLSTNYSGAILKKTVSLFSSLLCLLLISLEATHGAIYVTFRYDDMSADKSGTRQKNISRRTLWQAEQEVDRIFEKYHMSYVVSIIPKAISRYDNNYEKTNEFTLFEEDQEKVDLIKNGISEGRIELAQHGLAHT